MPSWLSDQLGVSDNALFAIVIVLCMILVGIISLKLGAAVSLKRGLKLSAWGSVAVNPVLDMFKSSEGLASNSVWDNDHIMMAPGRYTAHGNPFQANSSYEQIPQRGY
jgi:hypothetical protein